MQKYMIERITATTHAVTTSIAATNEGAAKAILKSSEASKLDWGDGGIEAQTTTTMTAYDENGNIAFTIETDDQEAS